MQIRYSASAIDFAICKSHIRILCYNNANILPPPLHNVPTRECFRSIKIIPYYILWLARRVILLTVSDTAPWWPRSPPPASMRSPQDSALWSLCLCIVVYSLISPCSVLPSIPCSDLSLLQRFTKYSSASLRASWILSLVPS